MKPNGNIMNKFKKNYWENTHVTWRKIGDSLLACSTIVATYTIANDYKWIGIASLIIGVIGKFLSNFFGE